MSDVMPMIRLDVKAVVSALPFLTGVLVVWWVVGITQGMEQVLGCVSMVGVLAPIFVVQGNEDSGLLYATLPLRRRTVIMVHYGVITALVLITNLLAIAVVWGAAHLGLGVGFESDWPQYLVCFTAFALVMISVLTPLLVGVGRRKAALVLMGLFGLGGAFIGILLGGFPQAMDAIASGVRANWGIVLAVAVVCLGLSLPVSVAVYERRDL